MAGDNFDNQLQTEFRDLVSDHVGQINTAIENFEKQLVTLVSLIPKY